MPPRSEMDVTWPSANLVDRRAQSPFAIRHGTNIRIVMNYSTELPSFGPDLRLDECINIYMLVLRYLLTYGRPHYW